MSVSMSVSVSVLWLLSLLLSCLLAVHSMSTLSYCGAFSMEPYTVVVANAKRTCSRLHKQQRHGKNNCLAESARCSGTGGGGTSSLQLLRATTAPTETGGRAPASGPTPGAPQVLDDRSFRLHDREHVWIWEDDTETESSGTWKRVEQTTQSGSQQQQQQQHQQQQQQMVPISASTTETVTSLVRNWCEDFVLALDLCPWAKASLQTRGAMRFFLVPPSFQASKAASASEMTLEERYDLEEFETQRMGRIVDNVAGRFQAEILNPTTTTTTTAMASSLMEPELECDDAAAPSVLERAAIYFVIFLSPTDTSSPSPFPLLSDSFPDFIDWFTEMEDNWPEEFDDVIVAPFHPSWEFGSPSAGDYSVDANSEACLDYEKRSPYPLVTLVSTGVVEKAGMAVTEAIGEHNKGVLMGIEEKKQQEGLPGNENREEEEDGVESKGMEGIAKKSHANASVAELWWSAVYGKRGARKQSEINTIIE